MSLQSRNKRQGKAIEAVVAKMLGGRRVGILGKEDIEHRSFTVEVKNRKAFAGEGFLKQAEKHNTVEKIALAVVHVTGKKHDNDIVMMRMVDFLPFVMINREKEE